MYQECLQSNILFLTIWHVFIFYNKEILVVGFVDLLSEFPSSFIYISYFVFLVELTAVICFCHL